MTDPRELLAAADHGVLSTLHPTRGVDSVPVCFVLDGDLVGIPIDTVKPKRSTELGRLRNLALDPRAALLVQHWDPDDWSQLWWVRAAVRRVDATEASRAGFRESLARKYAQYARGGIHDLIVLEVTSIAHWQATVTQG